ncbi:selenium-dependent xanthine dehydrogenase [Clostridium sp.]|uniref:selenium-dependent xanthine dehydrogenase n=1 Tax=Clostridium sp. TaxID=1506 RepID=UPI003216324D
MYNFILNGKNVSFPKNINLLEYLREEANLTSVKNGCGEGACGACMILINGVPGRACINTMQKVSGKEVQTVEGLSEFEKQIFTWAFSKVGAVQCGFCIPGMIISAKGLLNKNLNPTEEEIRLAIRGNICRCTGYVKIVEAIKLVATAIAEGKLNLELEEDGSIGKPLPRIDAKDKILGTGLYVDDMKVEGLAYGSALRTKYPRALVKHISIEKALKHPDTIRILTAKDIPGNRYIGHLTKDWPALICEGEETRYIGDSVALIASRKKESLKEILELIEVEYEEFTPISNTTMAIAEGSPKIHPNGNILKVEMVNRGNAEEALKNSKYVVTNTYSTPFTEHAFLEPESALAMPDGDGVLIYTGSQGIYDEQREISELLGLEKNKVRCISKYVGGGFGGKEDMSVQHHAALLAFITKKPIKVTLSRRESIMIHPKRHAMDIVVTTGCDGDGNLTAFVADIVSDTGAYASLGGPVLQRACTHAAGPYKCKNVSIKGTAVYTNNPPGGAFRGFGVTQSVFAGECNMNLLAEKVGISTWDMRYKNAVEPGDVLPNGQIADSGTAIKETLIAVKEKYDSNDIVGIACCMKNSGIGVGIPDIGRCKLIVKNGVVNVRTSAACIGQGIGTIIIQIICEVTGVSPEKVVVGAPDTFTSPNSGTTTASRQTVFTGEAARIAAVNLMTYIESKYYNLTKIKNNKLDKNKVENHNETIKSTEINCSDLRKWLSENLENVINNLEGQEFYGEFSAVTDKINSIKENPVSHVAYGYATQLVILNKDGTLKEVVAAHDVGRAINPINVEGQIEGGVVMGLGYALTEDYPLKNCIPTAKFGTLGLFRATAVPKILPIIIEKNTCELAYGAKGIGEITTIPTAPAVQGAYYMLDHKFRTSLPMKETYYKK